MACKLMTLFIGESHGVNEAFKPSDVKNLVMIVEMAKEERPL